MSDAERAIGRLEGKMDQVLERIVVIENKVESLRLWRASILGMAGVIGAMAGYFSRFLT